MPAKGTWALATGRWLLSSIPAPSQHLAGRTSLAPSPGGPRQRRLRNPRRQLAFAAGRDFQPMPPHACPEKRHAPALQLPSHGHLLMDVSPQTPAGDKERPRNL